MHELTLFVLFSNLGNYVEVLPRCPLYPDFPEILFLDMVSQIIPDWRCDAHVTDNQLTTAQQARLGTE
jgi:hypothetical protein